MEGFPKAWISLNDGTPLSVKPLSSVGKSAQGVWYLVWPTVLLNKEGVNTSMTCLFSGISQPDLARATRLSSDNPRAVQVLSLEHRPKCGVVHSFVHRSMLPGREMNEPGLEPIGLVSGASEAVTLLPKRHE